LGNEGKTISNFIIFCSLFYSNPEVLVMALAPYSIKHVTKAKSTVNWREYYKSHTHTKQQQQQRGSKCTSPELENLA